MPPSCISKPDGAATLPSLSGIARIVNAPSFGPASLVLTDRPSFSISRSVILRQDDEALLQDSTLPLRRRMAIIVRLGEKRILQGAKAKLDTDFPEGQAEAPAKDKKRAREGKAGKEEGRKKKSKQ